MTALVDLTKDVWDFLKRRKKYWLGPMIITLILFITIIIITQGSAIAPFVYSIF